MTIAPNLEVGFDMRADTPAGLDPDTYSPTLKRYHQLLWQKPLPSGEVFTLASGERQAYLVHYGSSGRLPMSSDTITTSNRSKSAKLYAQLPADVNEDFHRLGYTIGGFTLFPGAQIGRLQTINQARGMSSRIGDRFDLTLECIRRHFDPELGESPLSAVLERYSSFFSLFGTFESYVAFFLFEDLVDDGGRVRFFYPFTDFTRPALPASLDDYIKYRRAQVVFLTARNRRIERWWLAHGSDQVERLAESADAGGLKTGGSA